MENTGKKMFETIADMQKQAMENFTQMTENMQKSMNTNQIIDTDFFKKWYENQMSFFNQGTGDKDNQNPVNFFNTWMNSQLEMARNWFDQSQQAWHKMGAEGADAKSTFDNSMAMFNNWLNTMNGTYAEMLKNFSGNSDSKHAFEGMFNNSQNYLKMFELWMPMMKSFQNKSFTPDMFRNMFNTGLFKNMMDSMFNMQPDFMKNMNEEFMKNVKDNMAQGKKAWDNAAGQMKSFMPDSTETFNQLYNNYNNFYSTMQNAAAPLMKLVTPGAQKEQVERVNEMSHEMSLYNMKNAQMQYMMYVTGVKAMEEVANHMYEKMQNGEQISDFMVVYQDWLNTNDRIFVALFESEEYSKMQSELHSLGMRLKRKIDLQMEKAMENLPLINRSEMDSLYKTIYELKKRISELERNLTGTSEPVAESASKSSVKKSSAKNA
jgi:polyhydroxyalkanoate synthase subunit PhaE